MIEGTYIAEIIDRAVDSWGRLLGFCDSCDREREDDGTFKADDPSTPGVNEAWKTGKSPKKKRKKKTTK